MLFSVSFAALVASASALPSLHGHPQFHAKRATQGTYGVCPTMTTQADEDDGSQGVFIQNTDNSTRTFYVIANGCDNHPSHEIAVPGGEEKFVKIPKDFQGRIQRGTDPISGSNMVGATIFEITQDTKNSPWVYADVSLIKGCDGGLYIEELPEEGETPVWTGGFKTDTCYENAPEEVMGTKYTKPDGTPVRTVIGTEDYKTAAVLKPVKEWLQQPQHGIDEKTTYLDEEINPCHGAKSGRWRTYWTAGRP